MRPLFACIVVVSSLFSGAGAAAQSLRVAAASDLQFAMVDLAGQFEKETRAQIAVSYGSSGNFRTQIQNGAPFDLFFSADSDYPRQLISAGFAEGSSFTVYANGHLVLWARKTAGLHLAERGLAALKDPRVEKIAIANPEHAPYGRAAIAALQNAGLYDDVKAKLVFGENISQAAQFAQLGSAQIAIVARSLTFADSMKDGDQFLIPQDKYPPIEQAAVLINSSSNKDAAKAFLEFVKSAEGRATLSRFGLALSTAPEKR